MVEEKERPACPACGFIFFVDPKLVVAGVLLHDDNVLLVQRDAEPGRGLWSLPGGYVDRGEVLERAMEREVLEETGLVVRCGPLLGLHSEEGNAVVLAAYRLSATGGELRPNLKEVQDARWHPLHTLPPLAFPRDVHVIEKARADSSDQ